MKRLFMAMLVLCGAVMLTGCGDGVDENKTPAQIKSEAANMSVADLESMIAKYAKAVEKKAAELKKAAEAEEKAAAKKTAVKKTTTAKKATAAKKTTVKKAAAKKTSAKKSAE